MKLDIRTRTATLLAATGALLTAFTATALPAHADEPFSGYIDKDDVSVSAGSGRVYGRTFETLYDGYVKMSLRAITERASAHQGCVSTRVTYIYADGSIGMQDSPRVCAKGTSYSTQVETMFRSTATRDLVRYVVQLRAAWTPTGTLTAESTSTQFVGDAPDSLGTSERLDRDQIVESWGGASFRGTSDYAITATTTSSGTVRNVTNRVVGQFEWPTSTGGSTSADVTVIWRYTDGSQTWIALGRIYAGMAARKVTASSDPRRDVGSVDILNSNVMSFWPVVTSFGDFVFGETLGG